MSSEEFSVGDWIEGLAKALAAVAEAQKPYLRDDWEQRPLVRGAFGEWDGNLSVFALGDLLTLYTKARHGAGMGEREHYTPLRAVLDRARYTLIAHLALAWVIGPIIGRDAFWMQILGSGSSITPTNLLAGLMARASELPRDGFRAAAELHAFLTPAGEEGSDSVPGGLDIGYDAVLFYGVTVTERIEVAHGMELLPFEKVRTFVDEQPGGGTRPAGRGIPRLALGRRGGETVPVEAVVSAHG